MNYGRISLTVFTLITILTLSGSCYGQSPAVSSDTNETASIAGVTQMPPEVPAEVTLKETKEISPPSKDSRLFPAYQYINGEKLYGFIDNNGTFVIRPGYSSVTNFNDGYAAITGTADNKIIDKGGKIVFESNYLISPYCNGAAVFTNIDNNNYKKGYLDTKGNIMIKPDYIQADDFNKDGTAFVSKVPGEYDIINKSGNVLEEYKLNNKYNNVINFKDGYITYLDPNNNKTGVVNYKGEEIFKPKYNEITYLGHDLFAIKDPSLDAYEPQLTEPAALYDKSGKQLTSYMLYDVSEYHDGYASATNSQYTYFIDLKGKEALDLPKVKGRGKLTKMGDVIKAEIDDDLIYMKTDGTVIWQNDRTQALSPAITVTEKKFKPNKYAYIYYPYIEGLFDTSIQSTVNGKLYRLFTDSRLNLKEEDKLSVADTFHAQLMKNLLIINKTGYDYNFGAAHGMPIRNYYFIDINTGEFYDLSDLFKEDSDYVTEIDAIIGKQIDEESKKADFDYFPDSFKGIAGNQFFKLTKNALVIYFYPYDIAPYAAGFPEFKIPFGQLKDIIDYEGSFWTSFQDNTQ